VADIRHKKTRRAREAGKKALRGGRILGRGHWIGRKSLWGTVWEQGQKISKTTELCCRHDQEENRAPESAWSGLYQRECNLMGGGGAARKASKWSYRFGGWWIRLKRPRDGQMSDASTGRRDRISTKREIIYIGSMYRGRGELS